MASQSSEKKLPIQYFQSDRLTGLVLRQVDRYDTKYY